MKALAAALFLIIFSLCTFKYACAENVFEEQGVYTQYEIAPNAKPLTKVKGADKLSILKNKAVNKASDVKSKVTSKVAPVVDPQVAKVKKFLKIKPKPPLPSTLMVHTTAEWYEKAKSVPIEERPAPRYEPVVNEKLKVVEPPLKLITAWNQPPGSPDVDLSKIKKSLTVTDGVASPDFKLMAYTYYYYSPSENQISSEVLIVPLNTSETRSERILSAHVLKTEKMDHPQSGTHELVRNLYKAFVIIDWARDSNAILIKEKIGTANASTYRTYIWLMVRDLLNGQWTYRRCDELENAVMNYWMAQGVDLRKYRWDLVPLGWDANDRNRAIVLAYAYKKDKSKVFLGAWNVERFSGVVRLLSLTEKQFDVRSNGVVVKLRDF